MYGIIYKIINKINKKIYIGKTVQTLERRFQAHYNLAIRKQRNNKKLNRFQIALLKYGIDAFDKEIIDQAQSTEELSNKEKFWISYYDSTNIDIGYNISIGGDGGNLVSNYKWYNDGINEYYLSPTDEVPSNYIKGRLTKGNGPKDYIWINNGSINKTIKRENLSQYSDWNLGMLDRGISWKQHIKEAAKDVDRTNVIVAHKKFFEEHPHFTNSGSFKKGQMPLNKGKKWITDGVTNKYIDKDDIDKYIQLGWRLGCTQMKKKIDKNFLFKEEI